MERHTLADAQNMFTPTCFESDAPFEMQLPADRPGRRPCRSKKKKMGARNKMSELYFARRQALRQALVQAIMLAGDEEEIKASDIHFDHRRNISRYYFYVQRGMDLTLTAPLERSWVDGLLARVPARLRRQRAAAEDLVREARDEHAYAMRRAVVDFALRDPSDLDTCYVTEPDSEARRELRRMLGAGRDGFESARLKTLRHLHIVNQCLVQVNDLWHTEQYQNLRLLNIRELTDTMELLEFKELVLQQIDTTNSFLKNQWLSTIQEMFVKCDQKSLLPKPHERRRVKCFYNCLAVVMAHHLQSLCFRSIEDYTSLICDPEVSPSFLLHLFYEEEEGFVFKPGFRQFDDVILGLFDDIVRACGDIPRVEGQLYLDAAAPEVLKPIIPVETVNQAKRRVLVELYVQRNGPRDLLRDFYPFLYLVDGTAGDQAGWLQDPDEQLDAVAALTERLGVAALLLPREVLPQERAGMFVLRRHAVLAKMAAACLRLRAELLDRVQAVYEARRDLLAAECRDVEARAAGEPDSVEALMGLIEFVRGVQATRMHEVAERAADYLRLFLFLAEHRPLPGEDLALNRWALTWPRRMAVVLEQHRRMVERKTQELAASFFA